MSIDLSVKKYFCIDFHKTRFLNPDINSKKMKHKKTISILVVIVVLGSLAATVAGIISNERDGTYLYESIRGQSVEIYGMGIYRHMPAEVAPQGIAQDYITLFAGIPLLLAGLFWARKGSLRGKFLLAGTFGYFFVTYLFYLVMGMYNPFFLVYALLLGSTFFGLLLTLLSIDLKTLPQQFSDNTPAKFAGGFLIVNALAIAVMWLGIVVPPLLDGTIYPPELFHFTTLIVQGLDLGLLLPLSVVSGLLLFRREPYGFLAGPVYLIFLSILMLALTAKITAMGILGFNIIPAIFIIPALMIIAILSAVLLLKNIREAK
jgi:hypothetical protein